MEIYHGIDGLRLTDTAVAIGVFDGVHLGHQAVLSGAASMARSVGLRAVALTFDIHPAVLLAPDKAPPSICTVPQRAELIRQYGGGVDAVVIVSFTREFASLSPDDFVKSVLVDRLGARHVFVGSDFRYGHNRVGDGQTLTAEGAEYGFTVDVIEPIVVDGERVSSTRVRSLVQEGAVLPALRLLGHDLSIAGTVVHGKKLGREIGFPTANLTPLDPRQLLPADGVYAGYADLPDGRRFRTALSVGTNPTTDSDGARKVEAYLMDGFDGDLYGAEISLSFRDRLRGQVEFRGLAPLIELIANDVATIDGLLPRA
jgi:riboflavin kinase/FMN adenylyltransferase